MTTRADVLAEELAITAWSHVRRDAREPTSIEIVKDCGFPLKTAVYRLRGAGADGTDVVAKRSRLAKAAVERAVYEHMLPAVPVRALKYFGADEEETGEFCWLFLESVQGQSFEEVGGRELVDEWLAAFHPAASVLPRPAGLPAGHARFHEQLRAGREGVARNLAGELVDGDAEALGEALVQLELLERRWPDVLELCNGVPETVQHGDFVGKNLVVEPAGTLVPLDWEAASWGPPAVDLIFVEPSAYHARASTRWSTLRIESIERAALAGRIFWHLSAIRWATRDYPAERSKKKLDDHRRALGRVVRRVGWTLVIVYMLVLIGDLIEDLVEELL